MKPYLTLLLAPAALLTACGEEPKPVAPTTAGADDRTAGGDVRGGTISDAMLPLETVQSQSPSLAKENVSPGEDSANADADASEDAGGDTSGGSNESSSEEASDPAPARAE